MDTPSLQPISSKTNLLDIGNKMSKEQWIEEAKSVPWDLRKIPEEFVTLQENDKISGSCIDWWNTRSPLFCCLFPFFNCYTGAKIINSTDASAWKEALENTVDADCPESMKGVWWLRYNHAHEQLVPIFSGMEFIGDVSEDGRDGLGRWELPLRTNWSRDNTCFGHVLAIFATIKDPTIGGFYNLKEGIFTLEGNQWIFRVDDNQWWKIHYAANIGEEGATKDDLVKENFMYQWLKVLDKDGNPTEHWGDYVKWTKDPLPHTNCCESWNPLWGCCLSTKQKYENMCRPNPKQIVMFRE